MVPVSVEVYVPVSTPSTSTEPRRASTYPSNACAERENMHRKSSKMTLFTAGTSEILLKNLHARRFFFPPQATESHLHKKYPS
jgi:hypothetical protein